MAIAGTLTYKTELDTSGVKKAGSTVKSIIAGLGITKLISSAMSEIRNSIDGAVSRLDTLNNFPKVMSNLGIASEEADKSIKKMSDKLAGLPTTLDQGAAAVQRFTSANGDVEKSTDIFLALNNAILAGGASSEIQASALEQLSQAYAKGKPDMMEWRTAMTAMPAQLKQVAEAMGYVNADELGEALRSGAVSMDEFMDTVSRLNTEGLEGFQSFEEQARNSTGGIKTSITVAKTQIVKGVTDIIDALNKSFEDTRFGSLSGFIADVGKKAKESLDMVAKSISGEMSFKEFSDAGFNAVTNFLQGINDRIPDIMQTAGEMIQDLLSSLIENLPELIKVGMEIISNLIIGIAKQLPTLIPQAIDVIITIVESLLDNIDLIIDAGIELIMGLVEGLIDALPNLIDKIPEIIEKLLTAIANNLPKLTEMGIKLTIKLAEGLIKAIPQLVAKLPQIITAIVSTLLKYVGNMLDVGKNLVKGIWEGISNSLKWIKDKITGWVGNVLKFIKKLFGIKSPSKVMRDQIGQWLPKGIAVGIEANTDSVEDAMDDMYKEIDKTIKMENNKLSFDVISGNVYNKSMLQTPVSIDLNAEVEMDGQKVGRIVTPTVTKTIKNGGGI